MMLPVVWLFCPDAPSVQVPVSLTIFLLYYFLIDTFEDTLPAVKRKKTTFQLARQNLNVCVCFLWVFKKQVKSKTQAYAVPLHRPSVAKACLHDWQPAWRNTQHKNVSEYLAAFIEVLRLS